MPFLSPEYLILLPILLGIAFMLWVLWNLTMELKPRRHSAADQRTITIRVDPHRFRHAASSQGHQMDSRTRSA